MLSLRELERPAGTLAPVLLSLLHSAVAGQVAGVAEFLGDAALGRLPVGAGRCGGLAFAEHRLQGPGDALRSGPGLAGDAAAANVDEHVQPVSHVEER